jgi:hypothetical protein
MSQGYFYHLWSATIDIKVIPYLPKNLNSLHVKTRLFRAGSMNHRLGFFYIFFKLHSLSLHSFCLSGDASCERFGVKRQKLMVISLSPDQMVIV